MVTLAQAIRQQESAEESVVVRELEIEKAEQATRRLPTRGTIAQQIGAGSGASFLQTRARAKQTKAQTLAATKRARTELAGFREQVGSRQAQIARATREQKVRRQRQLDIIKAQGILLGQDTLIGASGDVRRLVRASQLSDLAERERALSEPLQLEGFAGLNLPSGEIGFAEIGGSEVFVPTSSAIGGGVLLTPERDIFLPPTQKLTDVSDLGFGASQITEAPSGRFGGTVVSEVPQKDFFGELRETVRKKGGKTAEQVAIPIIGAAQLGFGFITSPIQTTKEVGLGLKDVGGKLISGEGFPVLGQFAREDPVGFTARVGGEILTFKGLGKVGSFVETGFDLARARVSPKFRRIKTRELSEFGGVEEQFISIPEIGGIGEIGLIPESKDLLRVGGKKAPPTVRGPFGFSKKDIQAFTGERGPVISSARDLFGFGKKEVTLIPGLGDFGLFATPPKSGRGFGRLSRLGVGQPEATLADIISGEFTFKRQKPQLIVFPDEVIGRPGGFQTKTFTPGELEVTLPAGKIIEQIGQPGVIITGGKRVPIITAKIGVGSPEIAGLTKKAFGGIDLTSRELAKLSKASRIDFSSSFISKPIVSPSRFFGSSGISISKQFSSGLSFDSRSLGISGFSRQSRRGGFSGRISPAPRGGSGFSITGVSGFSGVSGLSGLGGLSGLSGLPTFGGFEGFGAPRPRREEKRRKKPKKKKVRKQLGFPVAPSFTAIIADIRGRFPTPKIKSLGLLPSQLRLLPLRRRSKKKRK